MTENDAAALTPGRHHLPALWLISYGRLTHVVDTLASP